MPSGRARREATDEVMAAIQRLTGQEEAGVYNERRSTRVARDLNSGALKLQAPKRNPIAPRAAYAGTHQREPVPGGAGSAGARRS